MKMKHIHLLREIPHERQFVRLHYDVTSVLEEHAGQQQEGRGTAPHLAPAVHAVSGLSMPGSLERAPRGSTVTLAPASHVTRWQTK